MEEHRTPSKAWYPDRHYVTNSLTVIRLIVKITHLVREQIQAQLQRMEL
jgi:hypothetical protein